MRLPTRTGLGAGGAVLGTGCHGVGGLSAGFLGAPGAAHPPLQPAAGRAVGLEGRGAQVAGGGQVQQRGGGAAERRGAGPRRRGPGGRAQRGGARGAVPGVAPRAGRQAQQAGRQRQQAGGPGRGQQAALLQQPQDAGGGEGFGRRRGARPLLQVSALVFLLLGAAVLEPDLHLGTSARKGERQEGRGGGGRRGEGRGGGNGEQGWSERGKKSIQSQSGLPPPQPALSPKPKPSVRFTAKLTVASDEEGVGRGGWSLEAPKKLPSWFNKSSPLSQGHGFSH